MNCFNFSSVSRISLLKILYSYCNDPRPLYSLIETQALQLFGNIILVGRKEFGRIYPTVPTRKMLDVHAERLHERHMAT